MLWLKSGRFIAWCQCHALVIVDTQHWVTFTTVGDLRERVWVPLGKAFRDGLHVKWHYCIRNVWHEGSKHTEIWERHNGCRMKVHCVLSGQERESRPGALNMLVTWFAQPLFLSLIAPEWGLRASQVALVVKNLPANARDLRDVGLIRGLGRSPGGGHGNALQNSCLENPMDRGAWRWQRVRHYWVT